MTIVKKLQWVLAAILILLLVSAGLGVGAIRLTASLAGYYPDTLMPGARLVTDVRQIVSDLYIQSQNNQANDPSPLIASGEEKMAALGDLVAAGNRPQIIAIYQELDTKWSEVVRAARSANATEMIQRYQEFGPVIEKTDQGLSLLIQSADERIKGVFQTLGFAVIGVSIISLIIGVSLAVFIARSVRTGVGSVNTSIQHLAAGDLSQEFEVHRKDEFGDIGRQLNQMQSALRKALSFISEEMTSLQALASEFGGRVNDFSSRSAQQRDLAGHIASAMEDMATTIREVAGSAQSSAEEAKEANQQASTSSTEVKRTVALSSELNETNATIVQAIESLQEQTVQISTVTDVINSIAEQTNLLALNAAIEAARAGEQGRGFAVVADEVRTLASRTAQSTTEIATVIEQLQKETQKTVQLANDSNTVVNSVVDAINSVQSSLDTIIGQVQTISDMNHGIAVATDQQSNVADQMNDNLGKIDQMSQNTAQDAESMEEKVNLITRMVSAINQETSRFRV